MFCDFRCPVAIKKWFDPNCDRDTQRAFTSEVMILRNLRHPNIVQFFEACFDVPHLCLITELLPTSLFDVLYSTQIDLDDSRICTIAMDIARALIYLHGQTPQIIHRDLKPANVLLDRTWKAKLCDFGLAVQLPDQRCAGTVAYMAPELLDPVARFHAKVDVYAFGVILNEMLSRRIPFQGATEKEIQNRIRNGERPELSLSADPRLQSLIQKCWNSEADARPTMEAVHDALQKYLKLKD